MGTSVVKTSPNEPNYHFQGFSWLYLDLGERDGVENVWKTCEIYRNLQNLTVVQPDSRFLKKNFPFQVALFIYFLPLYLSLFLVYCGCVGMTRADALKNEV